MPTPIPAPGFYGTDITNSFNNPGIVSAQHHSIFVNEPPAHWGDPLTFLSDLDQSRFIHVVDQYAGATADNRYTLGTSYLASLTLPANHTFQRSDIIALLHAAAALSGDGFGHIYHVFLPQGADVCMRPGFCYSPDDPANFAFCALHNAVTFTDAVGEVIFTLEPYQNIIGCSSPPRGTPNGPTADSTYTSLSHEVFETISDPEVIGWLNRASGEEMADLCDRYFVKPDGIAYTDAINSRLNGYRYRIQAEYSNQVHACVYPAAGGEGDK